MRRGHVAGLPVLAALFATVWICDATPVFYDAPREFYVGTLETVGRKLHTFNVTATGAYTCAITVTGAPTAATGSEFAIQSNAGSGECELWTQDSAGLVAGNVYTITVVGTDTVPPASAGDVITVRAVEAERLTDCQKTISVNAMGTQTSENVGQISCQSVLLHNIEYFFEEPNSYFYLDKISGNITAINDMGLIDSTIPSLTFTATCHDRDDQILMLCDVNFVFTNQNVKPTLSGIPATANWPESTASGTTLFTMTNNDPDGQAYDYSVNCLPDGTGKLFELELPALNFNLKGDQNFDFETLTTITCTFQASDPWSKSDIYTYVITVTNDNDAPTCDDIRYYGTLTEEEAAGAETISAGIACSDQDGDTLSYSFTAANGSTDFSIDTVTATINVSTQYDRDTLGTYRDLAVQCEDPGGLRGTCYITITITDINDNAPTFTNVNTQIYIDDSTAVGSQIGSVAVVDIDEDDNAAINCTYNSSSAYASYIFIGTDCKVYLAKTPDFANNTDITYTLLATDSGTPQQTSNFAFLTVTFRKFITTTVTTTTEPTFFDDPGSLASFILAILGGVLLLGLLGFCCFKYCCGCDDLFGPCCEECRHRSRPRRPRYPRRPDDSKYDRHRGYRRDDYPRDDYRERDYRDDFYKRDDPPRPMRTFDRSDPVPVRYPTIHPTPARLAFMKSTVPTVPGYVV